MKEPKTNSDKPLAPRWFGKPICRIVLGSVVMLVFLSCIGGIATSAPREDKPSAKEPVVFSDPPKPIPFFPGGEKALLDFVQSSIEYPEWAQEEPVVFSDPPMPIPSFPGGDAALLEFVQSSIKYPESAQKEGIEGRVVVQFIVKIDGSIGEVEIKRSRHPDLDAEAIRIVKTFPNFIWYNKKDECKEIWYTLPINFRLPEKNTPEKK